MGWTYGEKPGWYRKRDLLVAANNAEWDVPDSRIGALIRMQRYRAAQSNTRTNWMLAALILTILAGIVFFVGAPLWKRLADGQRETLTAQLATIAGEQGKLDQTRVGVQEALSTLLEGSPQVIDSGVEGDLYDGVADRRTILLFGGGNFGGGEIIRSIDGGASFTALPSGVSGALFHRIVDGQTILLFGDGGAITRSTDGGASFTAVPSGVKGNLYRSTVDGQTILLFGDGGAITRSTDGGASFTAVPSGVEGELGVNIVAGRTILLFGQGGAITRSTDGGASFTAVPSGVEGYLVDRIVDGPTILLFGGDPFGGGGEITRSTDGGASFTAVPSGVEGYLSNGIVDGRTILLSGQGGAITRSTDGGASFTAVPSGVEGWLGDSIVEGQTILLFGDGGAITRSTDGGASFTAVPSGVEGWLGDCIVEGQTILLFGAGGAITRSTDGGASFTAVPSGVEGDLGNSIVDGRTILLFGAGGAITRSTDGGASFTAVPSGVGWNLRGSIVDGRTTLLFGNGGAIVRLSDELSVRVRNLALPSGAAGDAALLAFIDNDLPEHLRTWTVLRDGPRNALLDVQSRRAVLATMQGETQADLDRIDKTAFGLLQRDRQRETFADFLATCRGVTDWQTPPSPKGVAAADPDAVTLACLEGWKAQVTADEGSWWQTLANQVPPGILILFLLATLSGLYRYNMRMTGFHHSRADALELLAQTLPKEQIDQLVNMADALAADKVEFGKDNSPADQAVEMFKAVMSRTSG